MKFIDKLDAATKNNNSLLCVGLDINLNSLPQPLLNQDDPIFLFASQIIKATQDLVCAYKPNMAFFEKYGHLRNLREEDIGALSPNELKMLRKVYRYKLKEAITCQDNLYYAGQALGHEPSFKEAAKHFLNNGCVKELKQAYGHFLHPQDLIAETVTDK